MPLDLDGRGHSLGERAQVRLPSGAVELLAPRELDLDRERVDALAPLEERLRRAVDPLVARDVEVVKPEEVDNFEDRVAIDEHAAEHLLLGALVKGHLTVGAGLERHARHIRTAVLCSRWPLRARSSWRSAPRRRDASVIEARAGEGCPPSPPRSGPQSRRRVL